MSGRREGREVTWQMIIKRISGFGPSDGKAGSYRFVRRISTDKRACVRQ